MYIPTFLSLNENERKRTKTKGTIEMRLRSHCEFIYIIILLCVSSYFEILRILMTNNYKPKRSLHFMIYAAEEVGLLGSDEIAKRFKSLGIDVAGVYQTDMILFKHANAPKVIYLVNDLTNSAQNNFLGSLIDTYVQQSWGFMTCGYGCSDHASWHLQGYAASFPFESGPELIPHSNPNIHKATDTMSAIGNSYAHGSHFVKLGLSYAIEMSMAP